MRSAVGQDSVTPKWFMPAPGDPSLYIAVPITTTYAHSGNELTLIAEHDPNGLAISRDTYTYTYDANGNRLTELHQSDTNADGGVDSTTEVRSIYTRIDNGLIYLFQEFCGQL